MKWKPIESAPREYDHYILLINADWANAPHAKGITGYGAAVCHWLEVHKNFGWATPNTDEIYAYDEEFTHWMPIPEAPR